MDLIKWNPKIIFIDNIYGYYIKNKIKYKFFINNSKNIIKTVISDINDNIIFKLIDEGESNIIKKKNI